MAMVGAEVTDLAEMSDSALQVGVHLHLGVVAVNSIQRGADTVGDIAIYINDLDVWHASELTMMLAAEMGSAKYHPSNSKSSSSSSASTSATMRVSVGCDAQRRQCCAVHA